MHGRSSWRDAWNVHTRIQWSTSKAATGLACQRLAEWPSRIEWTVLIKLWHARTPMLEDNAIWRNLDQLTPHRSVGLQSCQVPSCMLSIWSPCGLVCFALWAWPRIWRSRADMLNGCRDVSIQEWHVIHNHCTARWLVYAVLKRLSPCIMYRSAWLPSVTNHLDETKTCIFSQYHSFVLTGLIIDGMPASNKRNPMWF